MRKLALTTVAGFASFAFLAPAAMAAPSIDLEMTPRLPDFVQNPGGTLSASCWVDTDGTTPETLRILILDPNDGIVAEYVYPEATYWTLEWNAPEGLLDGMYTYRAEYYSSEGLAASVDERFLLAGATRGICAFKFIDENGNGTLDDGEVLAPGWEICIDGPEGIECEVTDEDGAACFFFIAAGTYEVCETLQEGYESTTGVCQEIVVTTTIEKAMFGNREITTPIEESSWGRVKAVYR